MTGFASVDGAAQTSAGDASRAGGAPDLAWRWDARSVNNRGLDVRMRLPSGWDAFETSWRAAVSSRFKRGSISLNLTVASAPTTRRVRVNRAALDQTIVAAKLVSARCRSSGVPLRPMTVDGLLSLRGVLETDDGDDSAGPPDSLAEAVSNGLSATLDRLDAARAEEGERLGETILAQLDQIETLTGEADTRAAARTEEAGRRFQEKIAALVQMAAGAGAEIDDARLAQELALLAVKADIREELDRLRSHIAGARKLLASSEPIGRKLDFLTQEFNREANTLCAKSQDAALTETGVALKVVIDQLREQASNVE